MNSDCKSPNIWVKSISLAGDIPLRRANFSCSIIGRKEVVITGGMGNQAEYDSIYILDLESMSWRISEQTLPASFVGHKSVRVCSGGSKINGVVILGGWCTDHYNESIFLLDTEKWRLKESHRKICCPTPGKKEHKTMNDLKGKIQSEVSLPEGRRDHTLTFLQKWSMIIMIGGWNALEWNNDNKFLEAWSLTPEWKWISLKWKLSEKQLFPPLQRRGHSTVYDRSSNCLYVYGGVFGYSRFLSDMIKINYNAKVNTCPYNSAGYDPDL